MTVKLTIVRAPACDWFILSGLPMDGQQAEQIAERLKSDNTKPAIFMTVDKELEHQVIDLTEPNSR